MKLSKLQNVDSCRMDMRDSNLTILIKTDTFTMTVTDRFLSYVAFDTQSDELTNMTPSTPGQMIFAEYLKEQLEGMGLEDISLDANGYLMATLPANCDTDAPVIGFIALTLTRLPT